MTHRVKNREKFEEWGSEDMIRNVKVHDLHACFRRAGFAKAVGDPDMEGLYEDASEFYSAFLDGSLDKKNSADVRRAFRLGAHNEGHNNFLKGIRVSFDLLFSHALTPQFQRYIFCDIVSSQSKMHKLHMMPVRDSVMKWTPEASIKACEDAIAAFLADRTDDNRYTMIYSVPAGFRMWAGMSTNYMQLARMHLQRKSDVLKPEWQPICAMIEDLPFMDDIVLEPLAHLHN
jgi:hypothetical protein